MPIYEYKCSDCGKISEFFVSKNLEEKEIVCKYCGRTCCRREEKFSTPSCAENEVCRKS